MIHYTHNTALLKQGETVLVDAGGEYGWYITDITRVWPVGGRFTAAQRDLYAAVLAVQRMGVGLCRASSGLSLDEVHRATEAALQKELEKLGFEFGRGMMMRGGGDVMGVLFPHHVGHYVGLDVHDVPGYPRSVPLKAGHCVTIEPGVYVPDDERFPEHFRGLAVRIEDSVCVDEEGPVVLTPEAVKEVEDIEALR
jgi:intermediate cleaving peptidase 55